MNIHADIIWILNTLNDPDSYIHRKSFKNLKNQFIKKLNTIYWVDDFGDIAYIEEPELPC